MIVMLRLGTRLRLRVAEAILRPSQDRGRPSSSRQLARTGPQAVPDRPVADEWRVDSRNGPAHHLRDGQPLCGSRPS